MYQLVINFANLTKSAEVQIDGLGVFVNGEEVEVTDEEAEAYRLHHSVIEDKSDSDGNLVSRKLVPGPTLLEAFKSTVGVKVAVVKAKEVKGGNN